jgi:cytochrome oxidase Cu insertion factor (SCO1/SenC/PrrC family)
MNAKSAKLTLLALACLFFLPLALAWLMYSGIIDFRPAETSNRGILVEPPIHAQLPETFAQLGLNDHWILIHQVPAHCAAACREFAKKLRSVRRALGRDGERVKAVYLSDAAYDELVLQEISGIDPEAIVFRDSSGMLRSQLEEIDQNGGTYLIDPIGNIMMHYQADSDPNNIRLDLKRLLKYAKTDPQR